MHKILLVWYILLFSFVNCAGKTKAVSLSFNISFKTYYSEAPSIFYGESISNRNNRSVLFFRRLNNDDSTQEYYFLNKHKNDSVIRFRYGSCFKDTFKSNLSYMVFDLIPFWHYDLKELERWQGLKTVSSVDGVTTKYKSSYDSISKKGSETLIKFNGSEELIYAEWILTDSFGNRQELKYSVSQVKKLNDREYIKFIKSYEKDYCELEKCQYIKKSKIKKEKILLDSGMVVKPYSGIDLITGDSMFLNDFDSNYLLVDFMYIGCMPCRMAQQDYKTIPKELYGKVKVIGINPYDKREKNLQAIKKAFADLEVDFPVIEINTEGNGLSEIRGYPTLLFITPGLKVVKVLYGHTENSAHKRAIIEWLNLVNQMD